MLILCAKSLSEANETNSDCNHNYDLNENVAGQINVNEITTDNEDDDENVLNVDDAVKCNDKCENDQTSDDGRNVAASTLIAEQQQDKSLNVCRSLAKRGKAGYFLIMISCTVMNAYLAKNMNNYVCPDLDEFRQ